MYQNNYDNYMQDFYFYNQNPNTYLNPNFNNQNQTMNLSYFYPSLYKIIMPVVSKVVQNSNYQFANEEAINSMTQIIYNIVEGDVLANNQDNNQSNQNTNSNSQSRSQDSNSNKENPLLKDIIKILVIKEIQNRQIRQLNQNLWI